MTRLAILSALVLAALLPARASAQPGAPGGLHITDAKVDKDKLVWTVTVMVPVQKAVPVEVEKNGMKVTELRTVVVYEIQQVTKAVELKGFKATDAAGKPIAADKLAELLKETGPVVLVTGTLPERHRKLFKDTTVFLESVAPVPPVPPPPPPVPAPPVPPVPPGR
jgi:hypothetical protein